MADAFPVCDEKFESSLEAVLPKFGVAELREQQKLALLHLISGKDVFVNLPTGFGKSLIYQLAPSVVEEMSRLGGKIRSAIILVISPLVSLMKDQVQCLERKLDKDPLSLSLACVKVRTIASADSCKLSRRLFCLRNFFKHSLQIRLLSSIGTAIGSFLNSSSIGNSERPRTFMRDVLSLSFAAHKTQQTSYIFNRVPGVLAAILICK